MAAVGGSVRGHPGVAVAGGLAVLLGVVLVGVAAVGGSPVDPFLGFVALGVLVAAPGVLALLGLQGREALWLPAALAAFPLAFLSFAGLTLPLLVLVGVCLVAWSRRPASPLRTRAHPGLVTPLLILLLFAATAALVAGEDPASWTTADGGGGSTGNIITNGEALLSLTLVGLTLVAGWTLTAPRPRSRRPPAAETRRSLGRPR